MLSLSVAVYIDLRMLTPLLGIALGLVRLYGLRREKDSEETKSAVLSYVH